MKVFCLCIAFYFILQEGQANPALIPTTTLTNAPRSLNCTRNTDFTVLMDGTPETVYCSKQGMMMAPITDDQCVACCRHRHIVLNTDPQVQSTGYVDRLNPMYQSDCICCTYRL